MVRLEASKLFGQLEREEQGAVRGMALARTFAPGKEIFKEGDPGDGLYVVEEGLVEISAVIGAEARQTLSQVGPGDFFGEMAVLEDKPRSASAVTAKETKVCFIARDDMLRLIERSPSLSLVLLREISNRLREFNRQYLREVLQTERLAVIGRFSRSIVHDLKNPLNIIGLTAEIAGEAEASLEVRQQAQARIRQQVDRISDLISEILEFTQAAQTAFVLASTDYDRLLERLVEELRPEAQLKSCSLELEGTVPSVQLLVNPKRLRRVFYNLIHNATDAMPQGGKIILRAQAKESEVITEIEDTGPGIAPEIAGQLFEAFVTYGKAHGTGLGLTISKRIVQDHHGWISARNRPGGGAIFSIGLPRTHSEA